MKYRVVDATEGHGAYIEDDTGRTVCDFYWMNRQSGIDAGDAPYFLHPNAEDNAETICALLNAAK